MYLSRLNWPGVDFLDAAHAYAFALTAVLLAALAVSLGWLVTPHGANLSPDSIYYLNVAENLCQGRGLVYTIGLPPDQVGAAAPLTIWPPAYPLLLCTLSWVTGSVLVAARWLSVLAFAGLAVSCLALGRACAGFKVGALAALGVVTSLPMLRVFSFAWTEPLFLFCSVAGWWGMWRAWTVPDHRGRYLVVAGVMWSLAGFTRYLGVVLLLWGALMIVAMPLRRAGEPRRLRRRYLSLYTLLAPLPLVGWLWQNYALTGYLSGDARLGATASFSQNVRLAAQLLRRDFSFSLPAAYPLALYGLCLMLLLLMIGGVVRPGWLSSRLRRAHETVAARTSGRASAWFRLPWWGWLLLYCLAYLSILIFLAGTVPFEPLETRLLSPIYPFLWLLLAAGARYGYQQLRALEPVWRQRGARLAWVLLLLLLLADQPRRLYVELAQPPAWTYNAPAWINDPALLSLPLPALDAGTIYTNMPAAVSFITRQSAYRLPEETSLAQQEAFFQRHIKAHPGFVIWYVDGWEQSASITADTLANWCVRLSDSCQLLANYPHAIVYQFAYQ